MRSALRRGLLTLVALASATPAGAQQFVLASATEQHWYALIDTTGTRVGDARFEYFRPFRNGRAAAGVESLKKGWITLDGATLPGRYRGASDFDASGFAMATDYGKHAVVVDRDGKVVREIRPEVFDVMHGALFGFTGDKYGRWGLVDSRGRELFRERYFGIGEFREGLAPVYVKDFGESMGWIDTTGALVIPAAYSEALQRPELGGAVRGAFSNGRAAVAVVPGTVNGKPAPASVGTYAESFIDRTGKLVAGGPWRRVRDFSEGRAAVQAAGGERAPWGYVDTTGTVVIPLAFAWATDFHQGLARVARADGHALVIDRTGQPGNVGCPCTADMGDRPVMGVLTPGGIGYVTLENKWSIPPEKLREWGGAGYPFHEGRAPVEFRATTSGGETIAWVWYEIKEGASLASDRKSFFVTYALVDGPSSPRRGEIEDAVTNKPRNSLAGTIASGSYPLPAGQTKPDVGDIMSNAAVKPRYTRDASGGVTFLDNVDIRYLGHFLVK